jgi:hypothetical protein
LTSRERPDSTRHERTSELIKLLKHSCVRMREEFHALGMESPEFTAVLNSMTRNTYILLVVHGLKLGASLPERTVRSRLTMGLCRDGGVKDER